MVSYLNTLNSVRTSHTASHAVQPLFGQCLDMLYSLSMCSNSVQTACHVVVYCSNTVQTVCHCLAMFEHFEQCLDMLYSLSMCSNSLSLFGNVRTLFESVRTVFEYIILPFHVFEQCSNSPPCVGVLFKHCLNSLSLFGNVQTLFGQCSDILYSLSMCLNSARTARPALVCCSNTV